MLIAVSCKEKYEVMLQPTQTSFLVVEGSIITNGATKINLSRTSSLKDANILYEKNAIVTIQSDNNSNYILADKDSGRYVLPELNLDENVKYRLSIKTHDNREYVSDYVQVIKTPDIDTITYTRPNDGIEIYVNTKDPENNTSYYRFEYEEAWEFKSPIKQYMVATIHNNPPTPVSVSIDYYDTVEYSGAGYIDTIEACWQYRNSSKILLGSTARLSQNRVYLPLVSYPNHLLEFSYLYSINIKQFGLNKDEYDFLQKMKRNTESLGSIFDAQPTELKGNFRCLTDTSEVIIGYVGATRIKQKRTFISIDDLPGWSYREDCETFPIRKDPAELLYYFYTWRGQYLPSEPVSEDRFIVGYLISTPECMDCRLRGSNKKPSYWP